MTLLDVLQFLKIRPQDKDWIKFFKVVIYCLISILIVINYGQFVASTVFGVRAEHKKIEYIRGFVRNDEDKALVDASVQIMGTEYSIRTDDMGEFVFNRIDQLPDMKSVTVQITKAGYQTFSRHIQIEQPHVFLDTHLHKNN